MPELRTAAPPPAADADAAGAGARGARRDRLVLLLGLVLFVLAALPVCADLSRYHGDERFYTDAALHMRESGDWLTPRYADGSERWNKPLAAYWLIAGSVQLFGASVLAARLPFLLAGALVLAFTARAARVLFQDPRAALFAAFLLGSSAEFLQLVTRSTPDALLAACIAASLAGAAELAFVERPGRAAKWLFFGGAGLAVVAKGALGIVAPLFGAAWIVARHGRRGAWRKLHPVAAASFAVCVLLAVLPPLLRAGESGVVHAFDDQVGSRATPSASMALDNFSAYALNLVRHFLPWSALAAGALVFSFARVRAWARGRSAALAFAFGWYVLLLTVFSLANIQRGRYLFPAYPLVAAALAACVFAAFRSRGGETTLRIAARALALVVFCAACALAWAAWRVGEPSLAGGLALAIAACGALHAFRASPESALTGAALAWCVALPLGERALQRVFDAAPAHALAARLGELGARGDEVVCVGGEASLASQLRLVSGSQLAPRWSRTLAEAELGAARFLVLAPEAARELDARSPGGEPLAAASSEVCGFEYPRWRAGDVRALLAAEDPRAALVARRTPYRIVARARGEVETPRAR